MCLFIDPMRFATQQVNRWNADVRGSEPCRSEGKVLLLASCHDTFPKPLAPPQVIWVSVKDLATVQRLRRAVCLGGGAQDLPVGYDNCTWTRIAAWKSGLENVREQCTK